MKISQEEWKTYIKQLYKTIPAYCSIPRQNEDEIPILEKSWLLENESSILTPEGTVLLYQNKLINAKTSGSTRNYMDIYWREEDYKKSMLGLWWYRYKYYKIMPQDKLCFFFTTNIHGEKEELRKEKELGFSKSNLTLARLKEIYEKMQEFKPKWLLLQPCIAILLIECMNYYGLEPIESIQYIEFTGEMLTEELRQEVQRHFLCNIANQYGANEFNSIAYECPHGKLHIMDDNVVVESTILDGKNEELIITTKTNTVMPLIRFRIGDYGKIEHNGMCPCGNKAPIIRLTLGRTNDWIQCENGDKINAYVFIRAVDYVNTITDGMIKQFQVVQEEYTKFRVNIVLCDECDEKEVQKLFYGAILEERLKEAEYEFEFMDRMMPNERTGKLACFLSKVKSSNRN